MTKVKKAFQPIIDLLQANPNVTVHEILNDVLALTAAKAGTREASAHYRNNQGEVVAIKCYYHKLWMDPRVEPFSIKASSNTGFNSMCKDGTNKWSKRNAELKKIDQSILDRVASGELSVEDISSEREQLQSELNVIIPLDNGYGFLTLDECLDHSAQQGLDVE